MTTNVSGIYKHASITEANLNNQVELPREIVIINDTPTSLFGSSVPSSVSSMLNSLHTDGYSVVTLPMQYIPAFQITVGAGSSSADRRHLMTWEAYSVMSNSITAPASTALSLGANATPNLLSINAAGATVVTAVPMYVNGVSSTTDYYGIKVQVNSANNLGGGIEVIDGTGYFSGHVLSYKQGGVESFWVNSDGKIFSNNALETRVLQLSHAGSTAVDGYITATTNNVTFDADGSHGTTTNWNFYGPMTAETSLVAPTMTLSDNSTNVATTAFVKGQNYLTTTTAASTYAPIASPTFSGTVTLPLSSAGFVKTSALGVVSVDTNAYLTTTSAASTYAPIASPTFTGTVTAPTPTLSDNSTNVATTAYVQAQNYLTSSSTATSALAINTANGDSLYSNGTSFQMNTVGGLNVTSTGQINITKGAGGTSLNIDGNQSTAALTITDSLITARRPITAPASTSLTLGAGGTNGVISLGASSVANSIVTSSMAITTGLPIVDSSDPSVVYQPQISVGSVSTANVATLSGLQTFDGVAGTDGMVTLLLNQSTASQSGLWIQHTGAWTRHPYFPSGSSKASYAYTQFIVTAGSTYKGVVYQAYVSTTVTIDTTAQYFAQVQVVDGAITYARLNNSAIGGFLGHSGTSSSALSMISSSTQYHVPIIGASSALAFGYLTSASFGTGTIAFTAAASQAATMGGNNATQITCSSAGAVTIATTAAQALTMGITTTAPNAFVVSTAGAISSLAPSGQGWNLGVGGTAGVITVASGSIAGALAVTSTGIASNGTITGTELLVGTLSYTASNPLELLAGAATGYVQSVVQNKTAGTGNSADYIVNSDLGTDTTYYGDFGMNSNSFSGSGSFNLPNAVYLTSTSGDLAIGTTTANSIHFVIAGAATDAMSISSTAITATLPFAGPVSNQGAAPTAWNCGTSEYLYMTAQATTAVSIALTGMIAGTTNTFVFYQGASAQTLTFTSAGVTFHQTNTATVNATGVVTASSISTVNQYYTIKLDWVTTTLCFYHID